MRSLPGKSKISTGSFACKTASKRSFRWLLILANQDNYKNTLDMEANPTRIRKTTFTAQK